MCRSLEKRGDGDRERDRETETDLDLRVLSDSFGAVRPTNSHKKMAKNSNFWSKNGRIGLKNQNFQKSLNEVFQTYMRYS